MASFKVRVLYDFRGEPGTAEMSVSAGQILTVMRTDVGEGWWEGKNESERIGLFPQAYVEKLQPVSEPPRTASLSVAPPAIAPPVLPPQNNTGDDNGTNNQQQEEDWDDDWDNDDTYSEISHTTVTPQESIYSNFDPNQNFRGPGGASALDYQSESNFNIDGKATVSKKSLNRFSSYVKSGLESYILGNIIPTPSSVKGVKIKKDNETIRWDIISEPYTVQITSPKKSSKLAGFKSFIAYHLTPSFSNIEVARRYKHFDWLHDRLRNKFNLIAIPPLPDKQVSGRYEEQFIEHRRMQLQEFISYMCRHPVLSTCEVWRHFLTCTDDKQWKLGKRNAEKDQLVGANFCLQIDAPEKELLPSQVEQTMELNINCLNQIDQSFKNLMQISIDQQKKCLNMYKREYSRIGEGFFMVGAAFEMAENGMFNDFTLDIKRIGSTYLTIGKLFEDQAKIDWQSLSDKLYIYRGITSSFPDIFALQRSAEQKKKDCERNIQMPQLTEVRRRTDTLTYAVFAELTHFHEEKNGEIKLAMKTFLQEQVNFYKNVVSKLEDTLEQFH